MPSVFHFSRNADNLPSFSSDYIPPTPRKNKTNSSANKTGLSVDNSILNSSAIQENINHSILNSFNNSAQSESCNNELQDACIPPMAPRSLQLSSELSSSSSLNDSNGENVAPSKSQMQSSDINENIFNQRQILNPRRTMANRSPLKAINIMEVVTLPNWKNTNSNSPKNITAADISLNNSSPNSSAEKQQPSMDLFGFEDFLDEEGRKSPPKSPDVSNISNISHKRKHSHLHKQLKQLKRWRPASGEVACTNTKTPFTNALEDEAENPLRQRKIKQMLCSTMIQPAAKVIPAKMIKIKSNCLD